ncbi:hypothetical protein Tco_0378345 [Tanacetum coccineum]
MSVKFSKLDQFLLNEEFNSLWGNLSIVALDKKLSDHSPIVLKDVELDFSPKPFRIFDVWMGEIDFGHVVEEAWKKGEKIEGYKSEVMKWELEAKKRALNDAEDQHGWRLGNFGWKKRTRRNNKNNIRGLMVNRIWSEDPKVIKMEMARYYKALFIEGMTIRPLFCCDRIGKFSDDEAIMLEKGFFEKEVWEAICGCGGDKSPGPDGFKFKFIKKFCDVLKSNLMLAIKWY